MKAAVQARLDPDTRKALARLTKELGMSESEVVRAGLRLLDACQPRRKGRRFIGSGQFDSGIPDLATNKKQYLEDFGR